MTFEDWVQGRSPEKHEETKKLRKEFWTHFSNRYLDENIPPNNTLPLVTEDSELLGISYDYFINRDQAQTLIYIKHDVDKARFDRLYKHIDSVETEFGGKLLWDRREGAESSTIRLRFKGGLDDMDKWNSLQDSMAETMDGLKNAFKTHIKRLR